MNKSTITVGELQKMLEEGKPVTILDVRPQEQRDEWKIAGSYHVDAYKRLNEGDKSILDKIQLPENMVVVTVCAAGRTSQIASEALREKGLDAVSLEGGMKAWNYAWNTAQITNNNVTIIQVRRVAKGCLSYIIGSGDEAIVIDASLEPKVYVDIAAKHNWTIKYVMDTHVHADYLSRTIELANATAAVHLFTAKAAVDYKYTPVQDNEEIPFGSAKIAMMFTPGHTPESISYLINGDYLFTGDTLFVDGVGRPDLKVEPKQAQQNAEQLYNSLKRILALGQNVMILPAHTSGAVAFDGKLIGDMLSNLSAKIELLQMRQDAFIDQTIKRIPPTPPNYLQIALLNKAGSFDGINPADLEAGANRCAVS